MGFLSKKQERAWHDVCALSDFSNMKQVSVNGKTLALFKQGGKVFCTQGSCSHEYSPLCDGMLQEGEILCEKHGSRFRLSDGQVLSPPACDNISVYEVRIVGDRVEIFVN